MRNFLKTNLFILLGLTLIALSTFASAVAAEKTLTFKEQVQINSKKICLRDLVNESWISQVCGAERCCRWEIQEGLTLVLDREQVYKDFLRQGLVSSPVKLLGAKSIHIAQTARELSLAEIKKRIQEVASDIELISASVRSSVTVNLNEESDWTPQLPEKLQQKTLIKIVKQTNPNAVLGWVDAEFKKTVEVYVSRRTIHPLEPIVMDDFQLKKVDLFSVNASTDTAYSKEQFPISTKAKQTLVKGQVLTSKLVDRVPSIHLGDMVTLILRSENLKISTKGISQGSAAEGEMVTVQLPRYNRSFRGKVIEGKVVEVWF